MTDDEVCKTNMPLACVRMFRTPLVPADRAVVLLEHDGVLALAVHPSAVTQQAVDEYNAAVEHVGRHGIGSETPARPHPAV